MNTQVVAQHGGGVVAEPPMYRGRGILGPLPELQVDQVATMQRISQLGEVVQFKILYQRAVLLREPRDLQHVLVDNVRGYNKQTRGYDMLRTILGNGLVTSEGPFWLRQRRITQPAFQRERISGFGAMMTDATESLVTRWQPTLASGGKVDVAAEMMRLTLTIVGHALMSTDLGDEADELGGALTVALEHINHRINHPFSAPEWLPTPRNRKFAKAQRVLNRVVMDVIAERRASGKDHGDLLSMLMHAKDEVTGEAMTDAQLKDEVMTLILAGHETTAMALTWTLWFLSEHPKVEQQVLAELAGVLGGRAPVTEDLRKLPVLDRVLKESMRLRPPVWILGRTAVEDDVVGGYRIPRGAYIFMSPYVTHRLEAYWEDPERFDPDRFLPERVAARPKLSYLPFSAGQRKCVGDGFATMEAMLILATLLQRVRLTLVPGHSVQMNPLITLRPTHGMLMTLSPPPAVAASSADGQAVTAGAAAGGCPFHHAPGD